jgi:hypothetical protein
LSATPALIFCMTLANVPQRANAQTAGAGSITGTLTDPSRAVVPDATVLVHHADTGVDRSLTSNAATYVWDSLSHAI